MSELSVPIYTTEQVVRAALEENGVLSGIAPKRVRLGVPLLDDIIGGISPRTLTILGALTNVGKSTTIIHMCIEASLAGNKVGIITLEDDHVLYGERIQSAFTSISAIDLHSSGHHYHGTGVVDPALKEAAKHNIFVAAPVNRTLQEVLVAMQKLADLGCDIIYIDYFTAILNENGANPRAFYNQILTKVKSNAQRLKVAVVIAAQIRRMPAMYRKNGTRVLIEPDIDNLAETGFLEHSAEVIMLLWRNKHGDTFGRLAKCKYGRNKLIKFNVFLHEKTGRLTFEEFDGYTLEEPDEE